MTSYVLTFQEIDKTKFNLVGGKGANLGELRLIEGIKVPDGFCISTEAFKRIIGETPCINSLLDELSILASEERERISRVSSEIREAIEDAIIPHDRRSVTAAGEFRPPADVLTSHGFHSS